MRHRILWGALAALLIVAPAATQTPFSGLVFPPRTVMGNSGPQSDFGQAIPFPVLTGSMFASVTGDVTFNASGVSAIGASKVTNAQLATAPALTLKGNNTGSTAAVGDLTISQASAMLPAQYSAGGRCTLTTLTPILTGSVTGATTVFYTPFRSQLVPIFDGTNWVMTDVGGELSQLTTDNTKSPAAVANNSNYDVFVWNDNGTFRATRGPAWSSGTTRGGSADIFRLKGVYTNLSSITNGPAAQRGTYVCTISSNGTASIDYIFGSSASGGVAGRFMVWNYYNRSLVSSFVFDTGTSYTYTSATIRQARASAGNQIAFLVGATEDSFSAWTQSFVQTAAVATAFSTTGMGLDSNTVFTAAGLVQTATANAWRGVGSSYWSAYPGIGPHTISRIEQGDGTNANTMAFFGGDQLTFQFPM